MSPLSIGRVCLLAMALTLSVVRAQSPCLVYSLRTAGTYTGYYSGSSTSTGLVVVGPQEEEDTQILPNMIPGDMGSNTDPTTIKVRKVRVQPYYTYNSGAEKFYYKSQEEKRAVGLINFAKEGSSKARFLLALTYDDGYADTTISDSSEFLPSVIGNATLRSPYKKSGTPIYMANTLASSSRFYDLNADRQYDNETGEMISEDKYLGQVLAAGEEIKALLISDKTTYSFHQELTERVKASTNLEEACEEVEQWLSEKKFQSQ